MFITPQGPSLRELAAQALSSVEHGYDLLAPKFDRSAFRTPDSVLEAVTDALRPLGPFTTGLDLCCGTGAGVGVLQQVCDEHVVGLDFSAGMLAAARAAYPRSGDSARSGAPSVHWVRGDARALPFTSAFDLVTSFGAFGHFLPGERPALFGQIHAALRPGGTFAFPIAAPPRVGSRWYWTLRGFDAAMRVRNALWHPPFVMYYLTLPLHGVLAELTRAGFQAQTLALPGLGHLPGGSPRCRLVVAQRQP